MNKKVFKQLLWNAVVFAVLMLGTFWFVLKDQDMGEIVEIARGVDTRFLLLGVGAMLLYFAMEALNIRSILRGCGEKTNFLRSYKHTLIGFFFAAVTPGASGGQPVEIYYMTKDGISAGHGTLALLVQLCGVQISMMTLGIIGMFFNAHLLSGPLLTLVIIGLLVNGVALLVMLIATFSPKLTRKIVNGVIRFLKKVGFKHIDSKRKEIDKNLDQYAKGSAYVKKHKKEFWLCILRTFIQFSLYFSVPYFIYKAFGLSGYSFFQIFAMESLIFMATSALPIPGAIGASEATFLDLFGPVFGAELLRSATLLNRGVTFYGLVFFSMVVVFINNLFASRKER